LKFDASSRLASLFLVVLATSARAENSLCSASEQALFSCKTSGGRSISICAVSSAPGRSQLSYRFGTIRKLELQLSADTGASPVVVEGNQSQGARGYDHFIRFRSGDYSYTVRDYWGGCPGPGQARCPRESSFAGVLVAKSGRIIGKNRCMESISGMAPDALSKLSVPVSEDWPN
jgi:hypothetical protein